MNLYCLMVFVFVFSCIFDCIFLSLGVSLNAIFHMVSFCVVQHSAVPLGSQTADGACLIDREPSSERCNFCVTFQLASLHSVNCNLKKDLQKSEITDLDNF